MSGSGGTEVCAIALAPMRRPATLKAAIDFIVFDSPFLGTPRADGRTMRLKNGLARSVKYQMNRTPTGEDTPEWVKPRTLGERIRRRPYPPSGHRTGYGAGQAGAVRLNTRIVRRGRVRPGYV